MTAAEVGVSIQDAMSAAVLQANTEGISTSEVNAATIHTRMLAAYVGTLNSIFGYGAAAAAAVGAATVAGVGRAAAVSAGTSVGAASVTGADANASAIAAGQYLAFDYPDALLVSSEISRFEVQWDGAGSWDSVDYNPQDVGVGYVDGDTAAGSTTYPIPIPFTSGSHTVKIRACNALECSDPTDAIAFEVS